MQKTKFKKTEIGEIPEDWDVEKLGNVCEVKSGKRLRKGRTLVEYKTNHPYIRVRDLSNGSVKVNELLFLDDETYKEISRYIITKDDVYISIVGSIGLVGIIPQEVSGANLTENCARLTNLTKSTKEWLSFYLNSKFGQDQIKSLTVGTTQGKLALFRIKDINIPLPKLKEQRSIAKILSDFDLKIELNQKMNKTLEAIGQALFKRWFTDFEFPNEKGKPYKSSGGVMVDSELGEIPNGWRVGKLKEISHLMMGLSPRGSSYNEKNIGTPLLNGASDFSSEGIFPKKFTTEPTRISKKGDLIFCIRATIGNLTFTDNPYCLGRGVASLSIQEKYKEYVYYMLTKSLDSLISKASGSVIVGLSKSDIEDLSIILPEERIIDIFNKTLYLMFIKNELNRNENKFLSQIKNRLLPKLMSGKIRVK